MPGVRLGGDGYEPWGGIGTSIGASDEVDGVGRRHCWHKR